MNGSAVACGRCGAVSAFDPGCPACQVPPPPLTSTDLLERRKALGLTQTQLAERLKVRQHHLSRWETGEVEITDIRGEWLDKRLQDLERELTTD